MRPLLEVSLFPKERERKRQSAQFLGQSKAGERPCVLKQGESPA